MGEIGVNYVIGAPICVSDMLDVFGMPISVGDRLELL